MSTRLDRLFVLLESGSNHSTRKAAAHQLGQVQKLHPHELYFLLGKLHKLFKSSSWDTRIAASQALEAILSQVPEWDPDEYVLTSIDSTPFQPIGLMDFRNFDLDKVMTNGGTLMAAKSSDYELFTPETVNAKERLDRQRQQLNKKLGLDVAASLGLDTQSIFSNDDLLEATTSPSPLMATQFVENVSELVETELSSINGGSMSNRERNMIRRRAKNTAKRKDENQSATDTTKKPKTEKSEDDQSNEWPLETFCSFLSQDLFHVSWEIRHGAATALREVIRNQGKGAGKVNGLTKDQNQQAHEAWLEDMALRFICVIALDRFGDFVSDQVVAPVRETSSQALGAVLKLMSDDGVKGVMSLLLKLLMQKEWQCRHGGLLGVKYLLAVRSDMASTLLPALYPAIFRGLLDDEDDVVSVAAASLLPVVETLSTHLPKAKLTKLIERLWNSLLNLDDLTSSTQSIMSLLSNIISHEAKSNDLISIEKDQLPVMVPRLLPFLSHSSSMVRRSCLQTLETLTSMKTLSQLFLPQVIKDLSSHLFQRSLLEHNTKNLDYIEKTWHFICDHTPLEPLLMSTCPLYAMWLSLISRNANIPLPPNQIIRFNIDQTSQYFLGGPDAQHLVDPIEKDKYTTRARCLAARLLGKLACFIIQPVPSLSYPTGPQEPLHTFIDKILLPNLASRSAYLRLASSLVIMSWCQEQSLSYVPESLSSSLYACLTEPVTYEEIIHSFASLQSDASDFVATLRHYKFDLDPSILSDPNNLNLDIIQWLCGDQMDATIKTRKLPNRARDTVLQRRDSLAVTVKQVVKDHNHLSVMTLAALAGAVVSLKALPEKLNPVIKPLMESVKKETNEQLQRISARQLALVLDICAGRENPPNNKVIKNLCSFVCSNPDITPVIDQTRGNEHMFSGVLYLRQKDADLATKKSKSKKGPAASMPKSDLAAAAASVDVEHATKESDAQRQEIQRRGSGMALEEIMRHFGEATPHKLPKLWELTVDNVCRDSQPSDIAAVQELVFCLQALEVIIPVISSKLYQRIEATIPKLVLLLANPYCAIRHMASRCLAKLSVILPTPVMMAVITNVVPYFNGPVCSRQGAVECIACILEKLGVNAVPYIMLLVVPVLGRMSDQDESVRLMATSAFATLVRLMPLDGAVPEPEGLSEELLLKKASERKFIDQLMNAKKVETFEIPIPIAASLRSYQQAGVNWLAFLNRYQLHGILCDDMGLGKTLQTICILASDHFHRSEQFAKQFAANHSLEHTPLPSLVICPPTLGGHWLAEIKRFVDRRYLKPFLYSGVLSQRMELRPRVAGHNLIISSYDVVRNDLEFFKSIRWNYLVLDEGHIIKNAKAKTTIAIKQLISNHRLILSGTPIQNSVLELWSLFDFLMPGFLGTERQFMSRYGRPIIASRDARTSSKEQEAGALAMEALHRQVLPFILRRMKEDVLKDLPPKITQDYYCDLSSVQVTLYEDFAKNQASTTAGTPDGAETPKPSGRTHVFHALQYLRKVCNHPKLVVDPSMWPTVGLDDIATAAKLPALRELLLQCGIGAPEDTESVVGQHRALIFCQLKAMMDIVEKDLLVAKMPTVTYLRLDGSVPPNDRHELVNRFNNDVSIDVLLLSTSVGGLGLNLTGADTVIFVEHDWNPMKDLQAMDRVHRIGQKKVVNVYRLITRNTIEEKIMGLQKFKLHTANTVISSDNASLQSMATDQLFDLFSLDNAKKEDEGQGDDKKGIKALLDNIPELWDEKNYEDEYDIKSYMTRC